MLKSAGFLCHIFFFEKCRVFFFFATFFEELKNKRVMYIKMLYLLLDKSARFKRHLLFSSHSWFNAENAEKDRFIMPHFFPFEAPKMMRFI